MKQNPRQSGAPRWLRVLLPVVLIGVWFALFGVGGGSFGQISKVSTNDQAQFLPSDADSTRVQEILKEFRGEELVPAVLVWRSSDAATPLGDEEIASIQTRLDSLADIGGVASGGISPVITSADGLAAEAFVPVDATSKVSATVKEMRANLAENPIVGIEVFVAGPAGLSADIAGAFSGIDGLLLIVALAAVFLILVIVYRSPLLPIIVLGTSMAALTAAMFTVVELTKAGFILLSGQTQGILMILVIGAATDYSLLYIARYREALGAHERKWDATWAALRGSWEPILASGGTVIAGLLILLLSELNSNKSLGPVAALGIVFSLLAALTLLPALLLWAGRVAFWPRKVVGEAALAAPSGVSDPRTGTGVWAAFSRMIARRPRVSWVAATLVLLVMSFGLLGLKADGVPQSDFVIGASETRDGQAVLAEHFPAGSGTPVVISADAARVQAVADVVLAGAGAPTVAVFSEDSPSGTAPVTAEGIQPVGPGAAPDPTVIDGRVLLQATIDAAGDSSEAERLIVDIRAELEGVDPTALVGGTSAIAHDTNQAAMRDRALIIPLVVVVILLILMLLLRSVLAPVLLMASVVLSFGAALGVSALVFNGIFDFPGADPSVPLFGFVFLVALGVDYNIFLMTRVREESLKHGTRDGVLRGLRVTGGVITSAGLVLAATFAALGVLPVLFLVQLSFIVAFGVLLDTFLVRTVLVPALVYDLGDRVWWPGALARRAPRR